MVWLMFRVSEGHWHKVVPAAFCIGIGAGNQHTYVLFAVPFILTTVFLALVHGALRELITLRICFGVLLAMGTGALTILYLPLSCSWEPEWAWGDRCSADGLLGVLLRRDYGTFSLASGPWQVAPLQEQLRAYIT